MPVIEVHLLKGYTPSDKQRLGEALTDASRLVVPAPAEAVTVMIHEMLDHDYYRGRVQRTPASALPDPCLLVHEFLRHLGARDLASAKTLLADDFVMLFPGAAPMSALEELISWSASRYSSIAKQITSTEAVHSGSEATIVYTRGHLSGQWPDGSVFEGIRFIDRFELVAGRITRQEVWNDLAEARLVKAAGS